MSKGNFSPLYFYLAAFKLVKTWLGPDAVGFLKTANKNDVQEYISAEYLPPHMGGTVSILPVTELLNAITNTIFLQLIYGRGSD